MDFKVTDEGLKNISQSFTQLTSLRQIRFECFGGHQISHLGIENFVQSLKNLVSLQEATLLFSADCAIMETEEQEKIIQALKGHPSLKKGNLIFGYGLGSIEVLKH